MTPSPAPPPVPAPPPPGLPPPPVGIVPPAETPPLPPVPARPRLFPAELSEPPTRVAPVPALGWLVPPEEVPELLPPPLAVTAATAPSSPHAAPPRPRRSSAPPNVTPASGCLLVSSIEYRWRATSSPSGLRDGFRAGTNCRYFSRALGNSSPTQKVDRLSHPVAQRIWIQPRSRPTCPDPAPKGQRGRRRRATPR